jgi:hypothetical protein
MKDDDKKHLDVGDVLKCESYKRLLIIYSIKNNKFYTDPEERGFIDQPDVDQFTVIGHIDLPEPDANPWPKMEYCEHEIKLINEGTRINIGCQNIEISNLPKLIKIFQKVLDWKKHEDAKNYAKKRRYLARTGEWGFEVPEPKPWKGSA